MSAKSAFTFQLISLRQGFSLRINVSVYKNPLVHLIVSVQTLTLFLNNTVCAFTL